MPVPARGQEAGEHVGDGVLAGAGQALRGGDGELGAGVVTGDAGGDGEGQLARVDAGLAGGVVFHLAYRLAQGQERPHFLAGRLGGPGPQDEPGAAQPGLDLGVAVLGLPPLVVQRGQVRGGCLPAVRQRGARRNSPVLVVPPAARTVTVYSMMRTRCPRGGAGRTRPRARAWPRRRFSAGVAMTAMNDPSGRTSSGGNTRLPLTRHSR